MGHVRSGDGIGGRTGDRLTRRETRHGTGHRPGPGVVDREVVDGRPAGVGHHEVVRNLRTDGEVGRQRLSGLLDEVELRERPEGLDDDVADEVDVGEQSRRRRASKAPVLTERASAAAASRDAPSRTPDADGRCSRLIPHAQQSSCPYHPTTSRGPRPRTRTASTRAADSHRDACVHGSSSSSRSSSSRGIPACRRGPVRPSPLGRAGPSTGRRASRGRSTRRGRKYNTPWYQWELKPVFWLAAEADTGATKTGPAPASGASDLEGSRLGDTVLGFNTITRERFGSPEPRHARFRPARAGDTVGRAPPRAMTSGATGPGRGRGPGG